MAGPRRRMVFRPLESCLPFANADDNDFGLDLKDGLREWLGYGTFADAKLEYRVIFNLRRLDVKIGC